MEKRGKAFLLLVCWVGNFVALQCVQKSAINKIQGKKNRPELVKKHGISKKRGFGDESVFENTTPYSIEFYREDDALGYTPSNCFFIVIDDQGNGFRFNVVDILRKIWPDVPEKCSKTITKLKMEPIPASRDIKFTFFLKEKKFRAHGQSVLSAISVEIDLSGTFFIKSGNELTLVNSTPFNISFNGAEFCSGIIVDACRNKLGWDLLNSVSEENLSDCSKVIRTLRVERTKDLKTLQFTVFFADNSKRILNRYFPDLCPHVRY